MSEKSTLARLEFKEFGHVLLTRDQGEPVRQRLLELLRESETVEVDLDGVETYTPSFMDEVLGKCLAEIGSQKFRAAIKLTASSPDVRKLANLVLSNRAARQSNL